MLNYWIYLPKILFYVMPKRHIYEYGVLVDGLYM